MTDEEKLALLIEERELIENSLALKVIVDEFGNWAFPYPTWFEGEDVLQDIDGAIVRYRGRPMRFGEGFVGSCWLSQDCFFYISPERQVRQLKCINIQA